MEPTTYIDFDLMIRKAEVSGLLQVEVHASPAGDARADINEPGPDVMAMNSFEMDDVQVKQFGARLFNAFLGNDVGDRLLATLQHAKQQNQGVRIRICTESPKLAAIPWEYLLNPDTDNFFALSDRTPIIRYLPLANPVHAITPVLPIRILVMIATPKGEAALIHADREWTHLETALSDLVQQGVVDLEKMEDSTFIALQRQLGLRDYHVFHFIGHGFFSDVPYSAGLVFEDENHRAHWVDVRELASVLGDHVPLQLVFLNACEAARADSTSVFAGTAQTLIRNGIPAVIAMQSQVPDAVASMLARVFYEWLSRGYSIETSLAEARKTARTYNPLDWAVPVLFTRLPDTRLFRLSVEDASIVPPEFLVRTAELDRLNAIYVEPDREKDILGTAYRALLQARMLVIKGESGAGKRSMALRLAEQLVAEERVRKIAKTFRDTPIQQIKNFQQCAIILPDIFGLAEFERKDIESQLPFLERLSERNYVIITTNEQVLDEALQQTRLEEWLPIRNTAVQLVSESYTSAARNRMIQQHIQWNLAQGWLDKRRARWIEDILANPQANECYNDLAGIKSPLDIKRLIEDSLPRLKRREDLLSALRRLGNLSDEMAAWFNAINDLPGVNDDLQCFVFTLSIFDGFDRKTIWDWYCKILAKLKKLNPALIARPFGAMIELCLPYLTSIEGCPTFAHPSFQRAALQAVAQSYREYLLLVLPDLEIAVIPDPKGLDKQAYNEVVQQTQKLRNALNLTLSYIAPHDLGELLDFVNKLAQSKKGAIRASAAEILAAAARSPRQRARVLDLLNAWGYRKSNDDWPYRWTAAITFGRMGVILPDRALASLRALAEDPHVFVKSVIPSALRSFVTRYPEECRKIFKDLAASKHEEIRRSVSNELRTLVYQDDRFVATILDDWSVLESVYRQYTLVRTCMIIPLPLKQKRLALLTRFLEANPHLCEKALVDALAKGDIKAERAWALIYELVGFSSENCDRVVTLASLLEGNDAECFWQTLSNWSQSTPDLRLASAYVVSNWKSYYPEKARPIVARLAADLIEEIAIIATLQRSDPIPVNFYEQVMMAPLRVEEGKPVDPEADIELMLNIMA